MLALFGNCLLTVACAFGVFYTVHWRLQKNIPEEHKKTVMLLGMIFLAMTVRIGYWVLVQLLALEGERFNLVMFEYAFIMHIITAAVVTYAMIEYVHALRPFTLENKILLYTGIISISGLITTSL